MFDTTTALAQITNETANSTARHEVSPLFPFTTTSNVRAANKLAGFYFFNRQTMKMFGSKIESALYAGTLFITSEESWGDENRHYTIRYVVPTGEVLTLEGASQLDSIDEARDIASTVAKALRESNLLTK
ncbi:hypothetical protein SEA_PSONYX_122 [Corynebacterium phage PSonyx]|nr:hypothetical protein SEA_PSONYX_122 [Corynebacterium phage PSonyx]